MRICIALFSLTHKLVFFVPALLTSIEVLNKKNIT
jgi:hypothetical protein